MRRRIAVIPIVVAGIVLSCYWWYAYNSAPKAAPRILAYDYTARGEVKVDAGGYTEVDEDAPIRELNISVQGISQERKFRVLWQAGVFQWRQMAEALYDRQQQTLTEYIRDSDGDVGKITIQHYIYEGVTDDILWRLARDTEAAKIEDSKTGTITPFTFKNLTNYGCTRQQLIQ